LINEAADKLLGRVPVDVDLDEAGLGTPLDQLIDLDDQTLKRNRLLKDWLSLRSIQGDQGPML
jgi:hypothetical protein